MERFAMDTSPANSLEHWVDRIEAEYREDPGLSLTLAQAARFWGLTPEFCQAVFARLAARNRLRETAAGRFVDTRDRIRTLHVATA